MAAKPKLTPEEWAKVRSTWESDAREGYAWLIDELNIPMSRVALRKAAIREKWAKVSQNSKPETIRPVHPKNAKAANNPVKQVNTNKVSKVNEKVKVSKVNHASETMEDELETISETLEKPSKKRAGQPSLFKEEYIDQVYKLCMLGATDKELADFFNIAESTINLWKKDYPLFMESLTRGKTMADADMAVSLYKRGMGYSHPEVHVSSYMGEITLTELTKHYPPETGAAFLWLKNRQPKKWKDKIELKEEINLNVFPPKEELDAIYAKTLEDARKVNETLLGRRERLGVVIDNETGMIDDDL